MNLTIEELLRHARAENKDLDPVVDALMQRLEQEFDRRRRDRDDE